MLFLIAGILAMATGLAHSVLGEILIFRHLRKGGLVPSMSAPPLRERNIRILWASWHLVTVFGWALAAVLLWLAFVPQRGSLHSFSVGVIVLAYFAGAVLVLVGTKGRHPGWIALSIVAAITWLAASAA